MAPSTAELQLLTLKAKNFSSTLYGVKDIKFFVADPAALRWHTSAMEQLLTLKNAPESKLTGPYSKTEAMEWVAAAVLLKKGTTVYMLFEEHVVISCEIVDAEEFVLCAFHASGGKGFSLFLTNPDAVIVVHDAGNELSLFRATRQAGYI